MLCMLCNKDIGKERFLPIHIGKFHKDLMSPLEYYEKYLKIEGDGLCKMCGERTKLISFKSGYSIYCSPACMYKDKELRNKIEENKKKNLLSKSGVDNVAKLETTKLKIKQTVQKVYGVDHNMKIPSVAIQKDITMMERYGYTNAMKNKGIDKKRQDTLEKRYNERSLMCIESFKQKSLEIKKQKFFNILQTKFNCQPLFQYNDFKTVSSVNRYPWKCNDCGTNFVDYIDAGHIPRCTKCRPKYVSGMEMEVKNFLKSLNVDFLENVRTVIPPKELDIYVEQYNLAIEFDGLYWHSELNGTDKNYHLNKTLRCHEKNIDLLHVFEDDWIFKKDIVKSIIRNRVSKIENKIHGRKCQVITPTKAETAAFLNENHLQGCIGYKYCFGLEYNNELCSILVIGKSRYNKNYEWEILRFCSKLNHVVVGGFSKLLNHFIKTITPKSIITYHDCKFGMNSFYTNTLFRYHKTTQPGYDYINFKHLKRESRLLYQKHLLKDKLSVFDENLTEWQNMQLNGYDRIWDCGNGVYVWSQEDTKEYKHATK